MSSSESDQALLRGWAMAGPQSALGAGMTGLVRINGEELDMAQLPPEGQRLVALMHFAQQRLQDLARELATLETARQVYVATLKAEIVKDRAGVDLHDLFGEDD